MFEDQIEELIKRLELEELEGDGLSADNYAQLFAAYLYKNDLCNARYLWKRIPQNVRNGHKELAKLHEIYISIWNNKFSDFFKVMKYSWSSNIQSVMKNLEEKMRQEILDLIGKAYTSIFENIFLELTNIPSDRVNETCEALGWKIDQTSNPRLILPVGSIQKRTRSGSSKDQLSVLTEFVSFLEN